ncbi:heptaprenyl diphosphate synthase component 1 [Paenibacillus humicus]|uniref:heptaprenyl diphosphate synthase component 1 n=1 Tax=Paenibacillus humicus TaxID=412861 RepID=UPI000FDC43ED|nr:heptaprenyl diphosphate synthase component 1 [Paenibacillus humicus]
MTRYRIPELASKYIDHEMIRRHAALPDFPDSRIRLLFGFLSQHRFAAAASELYSLAVSLVQLGLDTHDRVDTEAGDRGIKDMRERQLRVLAGDYFSSRFYQLLAGAGQIDMIRRLSGSICEANRLKTGLYVQAKDHSLTAEEYLDRHAGIRSILFDSFTILLEEKIRPLWNELLLTLTRMEVLQEEWSRSLQEHALAGSWGYWHVLEAGAAEDRELLLQPSAPDSAAARDLMERYRIQTLLADKLAACADKFRTLAGRIESDRLAQEVLLIGDRLMAAAVPTSPMTGEMR